MGWLDILISFARLGGTATSKLNLLRPAGFSLGFWSWNSIENVCILSCWQLWHQCQILPLQRMDEKSPSSSPYNCCGLGGTKDFNQNFVGGSCWVESEAPVLMPAPHCIFWDFTTRFTVSDFTRRKHVPFHKVCSGTALNLWNATQKEFVGITIGFVFDTVVVIRYTNKAVSLRIAARMFSGASVIYSTLDMPHRDHSLTITMIRLIPCRSGYRHWNGWKCTNKLTSSNRAGRGSRQAEHFTSFPC